MGGDAGEKKSGVAGNMFVDSGGVPASENSRESARDGVWRRLVVSVIFFFKTFGRETMRKQRVHDGATAAEGKGIGNEIKGSRK